MFPLCILIALFIQILNGDPKVDGNCMTGRIYFNPNRIISLDKVSENVDYNRYDMTIDYGSHLANFDQYGAHLSVERNPEGGQAFGTRLSTTRYIKYAKITAKFSSIPVPGIITTFITMSERKDEIDWELIGASKRRAQTNVFYKGIEEYVVHNVEVDAPYIKRSLEYTIDWRSDRIIWSLDGEVKRTVYKDESFSRMIPSNERWFPSTPSQIQISVWDGGDSPQEGVSKWAGGRVPWGNHNRFSAHYEYIDIQCYNDYNQPVHSWPPSPFTNMSIPRTSHRVNGRDI